MFRGQLQAATCRSTEHPYCQEALSLAKSNHLVDKIIDIINSGYTPVFEFVAPHNQVVVQYKQPRLVYLISRERSTGRYHFDGDVFPDKARKFSFKFGEVFNNLDETEFEGYVCHLPHMIVKAKTPWYMERHRAVDALMRPAYKLYQIVFDGFMDDLIAIATEPYKPALRKIYEQAQQDLLVEKRRVEQEFAEVLELSKATKDLADEPNPLAELEKQVAIQKEKNKTMAIIMVRNFTGLGLAASKDYVERGVWPHGFIRRDEQELEARRVIRTKGDFADLVRKKYPDDFNLIMALYQGRDPSSGIQERLMEVYRAKYQQKLYAKLDDNHEDG